MEQDGQTHRPLAVRTSSLQNNTNYSPCDKNKQKTATKTL